MGCAASPGLVLLLGLAAWVSATAMPPCADDVAGWMSAAGLSCASAERSGFCDLPLTALNISAPQSFTVGRVCPLSCSGLMHATNVFSCSMQKEYYRQTEACVDDARCDDVFVGQGCITVVSHGSTSRSISSICKKSCDNCPVLPTANPAANCQNDVNAIVARNGRSCRSLQEEVGCAGVTTFSTSQVYELCPATCGTCLEVKAVDRMVLCGDSPLCGQLGVSLGCKGTSSETQQSTVFLCPNMCGNCAESLGNATKCRPLMFDERYQYLSGLSDMSYRATFQVGEDNMIKGGYVGNPGGCEQLDHMDKQLGGRFCNVGVFDGHASLCVPRDCTFNHLIDFMRVRSAGMYQGAINGYCEDDFSHIDGGNNSYTDTKYTWPAITMIVISLVLVTLWCVATLLSPVRKLPFIQCWSAQRSTAELMKYRGDHLAFLDSFRTAAMLTILFAHTYIYTFLSGGVSNRYKGNNVMDNFYNFPVYGLGGTAVDTFFFLSGFLATVITCRMVYKDGNKKHFRNPFTTARFVLMGYVQRYLRIVPLMMFVMMAGLHLQPILGRGPFWTANLRAVTSKPCQENWWQQLLLISDLYHWPNDSCYGWMWYLSTDFHLALMHPFVVLPFAIAKNSGYDWASANRILLMVPGLLLLITEITLTKTQNLTRMNESYVRPWMRASPYLYGILGAVVLEVLLEKRKADGERYFGFALSLRRWLARVLSTTRDNSDNPLGDEMEEVLTRKSSEIPSDGNNLNTDANRSHNGDQPEARTAPGPVHGLLELEDVDDWRVSTSFLSPTAGKVVLYAANAFAICLGLAVGIVLHYREVDEDEGEAWGEEVHRNTSALVHFGWGLSLAIVCVTMGLGHGGCILRFLSHPVFSPTGKLTYGLYLVHPILMMSYRYVGNGSMRFSEFALVWDTCAAAVLSMFTSFLLWMLVEYPLSEVLSVTKIFTGVRKMKTPNGLSGTDLSPTLPLRTAEYPAE